MFSYVNPLRAVIVSICSIASGQAAFVTLSASSSPALIGSPVTLTAIVSPPSATGRVTFYSNTRPIATEPMTGGQATLTTGLLPWGMNLLIARYDGDGANPPAYSAPAYVSEVSGPSSGFSAPYVFPTDVAPTRIVVADLNGDGIEDLVTVNGAGTVSILLGTGGGNFAAPTNVAAGTNPVDAVVGDFNGDGIPDIAVAAYDYSATPSDGAVFVLIGSGSGVFGAPLEFPVGNGPTALVTGDWNGDGVVDLAITNFDDDTVSILIGQGNGSFVSGGILLVGSAPVAIVSADFNGDWRSDLAVANSADNTVSVLLGNGAGGFAPQPLLAAGDGPSGLAAADLNGDGKVDLVSANAGEYPYGFNPGVSVFLGTGSGTFQAAIPAVSGSGTIAVAAVDLDGDGKLDLAVAAADGLELLIGNGNGTFSAPRSFPAGSSPAAIAVGQFDGSGASAAVIASTEDNAVFILNGIPGPCTFALSPASFLFDANGGPEVMTLTTNSPGCPWTANVNPWITLPLSGLGGGSLSAQVQVNTTGEPLQGVLSIGAASVATTEDATVQQFSDVPLGQFDFDAVNLMKNKNITAGCGTNQFCPTSDVTRAQMAIFIVRAVMGGNDFTLIQQTPYFTDVPVGSFGFQWIQKMFELGITTGCQSNAFCPNNPLTRAQMAIFMIRARFGASTAFDVPPVPYFTDVDPGAFGYTSIQRMAFDAITSGCGGGLYCPAQTVTRGQMAVFLMRGIFDNLLPAGTPVLSQISPATALPGQTATFTVSGVNTNFVSGVTTLNPVSGLTAGPVTVVSPTSFTVPLTIDADAPADPISIYVSTNGQEAVLPAGLMIQAPQ